MIEPMSASGLGALVTTVCLALSGFVAVLFKGMSSSRCTKIHACCLDCDREVINNAPDEADPAEAGASLPVPVPPLQS